MTQTETPVTLTRTGKVSKKKQPLKKSKVVFDQKLFIADLFAKRSKLDLSFRQVAKEMKVNASVPHQLEAGRFDIKVSTLATVLTWLGTPASKYFHS